MELATAHDIKPCTALNQSGRFFSMANSLAKYHWQLLSEPAEEGPPRQLSHSPQSQSVEEQSQTSTLLFITPAGTLTLSQFGVAKDTIVPTVVTNTHIIAVITKQFTILTKNAGLPFTKIPCYQNFRSRLSSQVNFRCRISPNM